MFRFTDDRRFVTEWHPRRPTRFRSGRAWRRFFGAYKQARQGFAEQVATAVGAPVAFADTDDARVLGIDVSRPRPRH
jgi:hypothetical protein